MGQTQETIEMKTPIVIFIIILCLGCKDKFSIGFSTATPGEDAAIKAIKDENKKYQEDMAKYFDPNGMAYDYVPDERLDFTPLVKLKDSQRWLAISDYSSMEWPPKYVEVRGGIETFKYILEPNEPSIWRP